MNSTTEAMAASVHPIQSSKVCLHFQATVDEVEWETSRLEVNVQWTLRKLRWELLRLNEWDTHSKVLFKCNPAGMPIPLTTKVGDIFHEISESKPLLMDIALPPQSQQLDGKLPYRVLFVCRGAVAISSSYLYSRASTRSV